MTDLQLVALAFTAGAALSGLAVAMFFLTRR